MPFERLNLTIKYSLSRSTHKKTERQPNDIKNKMFCNLSSQVDKLFIHTNLLCLNPWTLMIHTLISSWGGGVLIFRKLGSDVYSGDELTWDVSLYKAGNRGPCVNHVIQSTTVHRPQDFWRKPCDLYLNSAVFDCKSASSKPLLYTTRKRMKLRRARMNLSWFIIKEKQTKSNLINW